MAPHEARDPVTPDNLSPVVSIMTWILMSSSIMGVTAKIWIKRVLSDSLGLDDWVLILSLALVVAQSIAVSFQAANGIGMHMASLDGAQIEVFQKAGYASSLLLLPCLAVSKSVILLLLGSITPVVSHFRTILAFGGFIVLWTIASLVAAALQCEAPDRWAILGPRCFDQTAFWTYYGIINIATEAVLFILPLWVFWRARIARGARAGLIFCFGTRITIIAAAGYQLAALRALGHSTDPTFDSWTYYLATQFLPNLSIVTACIPYVKNLLLGMESGYFQTGAFGSRKSEQDDQSSRGRSWPGLRRSKQSSAQPSALRSEVDGVGEELPGRQPALGSQDEPGDLQIPRTVGEMHSDDPSLGEAGRVQERRPS